MKNTVEVRVEGRLFIDASVVLEALGRRVEPDPESNGGRRWKTEQDVAEYTRVSVHTLRDWRRTGVVRVLPFHQLGTLVRYDRAEVDAAIHAGKVETNR